VATATNVLTFAGSGTNLPIVRLLAASYESKHPGVHIIVPPSIGSTSGIRATADGAIDIGLVSRRLSSKETHLGLEIYTYAHTPLIIGVHPTVPAENLTYGEIVDIYRGKKSKWSNGKEIIVLTREPSDSTIEVMNREIAGFAAAYLESQDKKRWTTLFKDAEMNEALARTPNAIGFTDLGSLTIEKHLIKPLKVNGIAPSIKNIRQGRYLLVKPLMFVYRKDKLTPAARDFMNYVQSKEGRRILLRNGYLPEN
jgi:phosphate transport system substrate-binding protein